MTFSSPTIDKLDQHSEGRRRLAVSRSALFSTIVQTALAAPLMYWLWLGLSWRRTSEDWKDLQGHWQWLFALILTVGTCWLLRAALGNLGRWWFYRLQARCLLEPCPALR